MPPFCGSLKPPKCIGSPTRSGSKFSREIDSHSLAFLLCEKFRLWEIAGKKEEATIQDMFLRTEECLTKKENLR